MNFIFCKTCISIEEGNMYFNFVRSKNKKGEKDINELEFDIDITGYHLDKNRISCATFDSSVFTATLITGIFFEKYIISLSKQQFFKEVIDTVITTNNTVTLNIKLNNSVYKIHFIPLEENTIEILSIRLQKIQKSNFLFLKKKN